MKRHYNALFLFLILLLIILPMRVFAHPGKTDGNGGHTDHDTGEYHYHHGYPAHEHYDIDGDGITDCPYDFDDKTDYSSDSRNSGTQSQSSVSNTTNSLTTDALGHNEEMKKVPAWVYWIIVILCCSIVALIFHINEKNKQLSAQAIRFRNSTSSEEARVKAGICALHEALVKEYGSEYLYKISGANPGDFVDNAFLPHSASCLADPNNDRYTFYLGSVTQYIPKYHHRSCRYARGAYSKNAYHLRNRHSYQPCSRCSCKLPDTTWVDRYIVFHTFLKQYIDLKTEAKPPECKVLNPNLGNVTYDMVEQYANQIGVYFETAQMLINAEREEAGISPIHFEKTPTQKSIFDDPSIKINW